MKITNKYNLPPIVVGAILMQQKAHKPVDGRIGVTTLMNPPLVFRLMQQHWDEIEMDVTDLMWAFEGSAIHSALDAFAKRYMAGNLSSEFIEKYQSVVPNSPRVETEKWVSAEIDGWQVRGVIDVYDIDNAALEDYKRTSTWSFVYRDKSMDSWTKQLNIYRYLMDVNGKEVNKLYINGFLRDWQSSKVGSGNYPDASFARVEIPVWDLKEAEEYLHERVRLFKESADKLEPCTPEERWRSGGQFALMLPNRKTAKKLFDSEKELIEWAKKFKVAKYTIERRKIVDRKCKDYCSVAQFCPFNIYNKKKAEEIPFA